MILRWLKACGWHGHWDRSNKVSLNHLLALLLLDRLLMTVFRTVFALGAFPIHEKALSDDLEARCAAYLQ